MIQFGTGKVDFAGVFDAESRRLRWTADGRVLQGRRDRGGDDGQRAQPRVPRGGIGEALGGLAQGSDLVFHMSIMLNYKT